MPDLPLPTADFRPGSVSPARAIRRARGFCVGLLAAMMVLSAAALPASAHSRRSSAGPVSGIAIPNLTHGQMAVIADYRNEILRLAARQPAPDMAFLRLLNFANIQFSFCMWGLMPLSISDESSPFNECGHAYLAATRALLLRMRALPDRQPAVDDLISRIETDMVRNQASLVLCQYSGETFNTADVIRPDWKRLFLHAPSFAAFAAFLLVFSGGIAAMVRMTRPADRLPRGR